MDQVEGEGSQQPKRLVTLPRAQPGHPEGLVLHADSGLLVAGREFHAGKVKGDRMFEVTGMHFFSQRFGDKRGFLSFIIPHRDDG